MPELKKEDVKVTVENGVLMITGERKFEKEEKKRKYHRVERGYGTFMRSFTLPDDADANRVKAEFKNGVLTVHLPKSENARPTNGRVTLLNVGRSLSRIRILKRTPPCRDATLKLEAPSRLG